MKIVALIPAKKKSTRLPSKNFLILKKKNIFDYTISAAKKSKLFDKICISSDDHNFLNNLNRPKIEKFYRSKKLGKKNTPLVKVCLNFIKEFEKKYFKIDILCLLYPTAPLRDAEDIKKTFKLLNKKCHFALAATTYSMPPQQALFLLNKEYTKPVFKKLVKKNESEIGKIVVDNGSTYFCYVKKFKRNKSFYGKNLRVYIMKKSQSIDLNDTEDLKILKKLI